MNPNNGIFDELRNTIKYLRTHSWVLLCIIVLAALAAYLVLEKRSAVNVPRYVDQELKNSPDVDLVLNLKIRKPAYIRLEPILGLIDLQETSATAYAVPLLKNECGGKVDILLVEEGGALKRVGGREFCYVDSLKCPEDEHKRKERWWQWELSRVGRNYWFLNGFPPGKVTLRAVLTLYKPGVQFVSNDVQIDVIEPTGDDLEAYTFLSAPQAINIGNETASQTIVSSGFLKTRESYRWEKFHRYFVAHYPDSIYANFVRYTMAHYLPNKIAAAPAEERDAVVEDHIGVLREITQNPPEDFPWLSEVYYYLIRYYKMHGDTAAFNELKEEVLRRHVSLDDGNGIRRLIED